MSKTILVIEDQEDNQDIDGRRKRKKSPFGIFLFSISKRCGLQGRDDLFKIDSTGGINDANRLCQR